MARQLRQLLRVIPPPADKSGHTLTRGTKVLTPGGAEIKGIYRIELVGDVGDVWRAVLHCHVQPPTLSAECTVVDKSMPWWRRWWAYVSGAEIEVTSLESESREFVNPKTNALWNNPKPAPPPPKATPDPITERLDQLIKLQVAAHSAQRKTG